MSGKDWWKTAQHVLSAIVFSSGIALINNSANATLVTDSTALYFDGVNDFIEIVDSTGSSLDISHSITLESWVNFTSYPNCCWNVVIAKSWSHSTANASYSIAYSNHPSDPISSDTLIGSFGAGSDGVTPTGVLQIDASTSRDGRWHHLATTYDFGSSTTSLYVDGILMDTGVRTESLLISNFSVYIANQLGFDRRTFNGYIDEVRIWNVARSQDEIVNSMFYELSGTEAGLAGYWNFNEGMGSVVYDSSGNGNNGTIFGNPVWSSWNSAGPVAPSIPVPEPTPLIIFGFGLAFFGLMKRRNHVLGS